MGTGKHSAFTGVMTYPGLGLIHFVDILVPLQLGGRTQWVLSVLHQASVQNQEGTQMAPT
jgi:hypothetical protein